MLRSTGRARCDVLLAGLVVVGALRNSDDADDVRSESPLRETDSSHPGGHLLSLPRRQKVAGGLRVNSREALLAGGDSGPAFVLANLTKAC